MFSEYFPLDERSMPGDEGNSSMLAVSGILSASRLQGISWSAL